MKRACMMAFVVFLFPPYLLGQKGQVLTQHNDKWRTGANLSETQLNVSNVNSRSFGLVFSLPVDGAVYAQPLYAPALTFPDGSVHNVVYIATMHNNVYAFDADNTSGILLWQKNLGPYAPQNFMAMSQAAAGFDLGEIIKKLINGTLCAAGPAVPNQPRVNIQGGYGITSTPVIDLASNTLFAVAKTMDSDSGMISDTVHYSLHALNLTTGHERDNSPVRIEGDVPSTSKEAMNGKLPFKPWMHLQRPGLLLSLGTVYIAFGAHQDTAGYHGWIFAYDAKSFQPKQPPKAVFSTTPNANDGEGGIWQSGNGLAADPSGNVYFMTGNGPFDADHGGSDLGDSFVKLDKDLNVVDWFTPQDFNDMDSSDVDLGSAGPMLFPDDLFTESGLSPTLVGGGKKGVFYLLDRNGMGHHLEDDNHPPLQKFQAAQGVDNTLVDVVGGALLAAAAADSFFAGVAYATGNPVAGAALTVAAVALVTAATVAFSTNVCGVDYHHIHGSPVVWNSPADGPLVYVWGERDKLRAYKFDPVNRRFPSTSPAYQSSMKDPDSGDFTQKLMPGGILSVSANGSAPGTGILWASVPERGNALADLAPGDLRAFDAANIGHELWCASTGTFAKFNPPTVVNGKVYLATFDNRVNVYGLADRKSFQGGFHTKSSPFVSGGYVYFQGTDDKLWKVNIDNPSDNTWLGGYNTKSPPFVSNGYVYFQGKGSGDNDDRLYKVNVNNPNGDNTWLGGYKTKSSPFVSNGYVYFQGSGSGDKDNRLYKVDVNNPNGPNNWLGGFKTQSTPFAAGGYVYFQGTDNKLWKVNIDNPKSDNTWVGGFMANSTPFVPGDGFIYFQGTDNELWKVPTITPPKNAATGAVTVVNRNPNHLDVFWIGQDGAVWTTPWDAASGWRGSSIISPANNAATGAVTVVNRNPNHLDVFWIGRDGAWWTTWWDAASGWAAAFNIGSSSVNLGGLKTQSSPFVEDGTYVFFQGTDDQLWRVSTNGTGLSSPGCGNSTKATPFVYGNSVFFRGTDDRLLMIGADE
jgi:hypothetical protein